MEDDEEIALLEKMLEEVDDTGRKNEEEEFDNNFGNEINKKLKAAEETRKYNAIRVPNDNESQPSTSSSFQRSIMTSGRTSIAGSSASSFSKETAFCDPIFGLRIINPVISSVSLKERMDGKQAVTVQRVRFHTERGDVSKDWVIAAVLVNKTVKKSQKGDQFSIWTLSDLRGEIKTCTLFLFQTAHKELWKTNPGTVIAILNPKVLQRKDDKVEAALSIDNNQRVMILGQSKDLGTCKAKKNNGDACGAIVNKTDCEYCIYHMKQEYSKIKRSEFQNSGGLGRGLQELRNKVLGKSEIFYAGQSFVAQKALKPIKQMKKDRERMMTLSEYFTAPYNPDRPPSIASTSTNGAVKRAPSIDANHAQRKKDIERLKLLQGTETPIMIEPAKERTKAPKKDNNFVPKLSTENLTFSFSVPTSSAKKNDIAKQKAAAILKKKPLETANPNLVKYRGTEAGKKRIADELTSPGNAENNAKKVKLSNEEELKKKKEYLNQMINKKSSHDDLVQEKQREVEQKTFDRLEKKEAMEERMANTMELNCKAVICGICKYIYFSASDYCKNQRHKLRVVDATKRFYQCGDCKSRTITLFRIPRDPCRNCHSKNWKRTGMISERVAYVGEALSVRGDEEMFIGSASKANINLLVPEESK